jgi:hypothetical protein
MARPEYDPVKIALADLVFESAKLAFNESNRGHTLSAAHSPLEDTLIELIPISDLEATVRVSGQGAPRYFSIKVHSQH